MPATEERNDAIARERGSALIIVILLTLVVTAFCTTMLLTSNTDREIAVNENDAERALFASKAGLSYGYRLFNDKLLTPTPTGATFDSFASAISTPLEGAAFTGLIYDQTASAGQGQLYKIVSTGTYKRGARTTELVLQVVPESLKYGYMAFNEATLHRHDTSGIPSFQIKSTIFSNNIVTVDEGLTIDGSIVASGAATINSLASLPSQIKGDVFVYSLDNDGTITGKAKYVTSVNGTTGSPNVTDNQGSKYVWYSGRSNPASTATGSGSIAGGQSRYVVVDGDQFNYTIFNQDGSLIINPPVNVVKYVPPPTIDYAAMKTEADKNDATYFTTASSAVSYLISKRVTEVIGGQTLKTIKVGTTSAPEYIYVNGNLALDVDPANTDTPASGKISADGLYIEGGLFVSGDFSFNGRAFTNPTTYPAGYYELSINALPYCFPALIAYPEPSTGTIATWTPADTPAMVGNKSDITMSSGGSDYEGFIYINGLTYSEAQTHIHHTKSDKELVKFNGAELGYKLHNCDYFQFSYDPTVRCSKFLGVNEGTPQIVSYRELR